MGYMTVVKILNDGWHIIKDNPEQFVENIEKGMHQYSDRLIVEYPVGNYVNPMSVHKSVHADIPQLLLVHQNAMWDLNTVYTDFAKGVNSPERVKRHMEKIEYAKELLKSTGDSLLYEVSLRIKNEIVEKGIETSDESILAYIKTSDWADVGISHEKILKVLHKYLHI